MFYNLNRNNMRKKLVNLLAELPEPHRARAMANASRRKCNGLGLFALMQEDLPGALEVAFNWAETPEGFAYWRKVFIDSVQNADH